MTHKIELVSRDSRRTLEVEGDIQRPTLVIVEGKYFLESTHIFTDGVYLELRPELVMGITEGGKS